VFVVNGWRDAEDGVPAGVYTNNVSTPTMWCTARCFTQCTHFAAIHRLAGM
jgi:hypothetical protein